MAAPMNRGLAIHADQRGSDNPSIDLLMLAAVAGTKLTLRAEGDDAREAVDALIRMIEEKFDEE